LIRVNCKIISSKQNFGLRVISLEQSLTAGARVDEQIRDAGPIEFIELFDNASFVVTDSFHGTCFALNFSKPFCSSFIRQAFKSY